MERGQRRSPQQPHRGQVQRPTQRPPQRRPVQSGRPSQPGPYRRKRRRSKKPWIIGAIALLLLIIIIGSIGGKDDSGDRVKQNAEEVTAFSDQIRTTMAPNISIATQVPTQAPTSVPTSRPTAAPSLFPQTIFNKNGVKISITGFNKYGTIGPELKITVENDSGMNLYLVTGELYCNGWQIKDFTGLFELANGSKAADTIYIYDSDLEDCGLRISDLKNVTFRNATIRNNDDYTQSYDFEMSATLQ